jgi:hypothetical protein
LLPRPRMRDMTTERLALEHVGHAAERMADSTSCDVLQASRNPACTVTCYYQRKLWYYQAFPWRHPVLPR